MHANLYFTDEADLICFLFTGQYPLLHVENNCNFITVVCGL